VCYYWRSHQQLAARKTHRNIALWHAENAPNSLSAAVSALINNPKKDLVSSL
jgi:hypothetical protein